SGRPTASSPAAAMRFRLRRDRERSRGYLLEQLAAPRRPLELGAEVGMGDGDQLAGPLAQALARQTRDAVFGHHVVDVGARGDHARAVLQGVDDARQLAALG